MITCARPARLLHSLRLTASSASKRPRRRGGEKKVFRERRFFAVLTSAGLTTTSFHSSSFSEVPDGNLKKKSSALQFAASIFCSLFAGFAQDLFALDFFALQPTAPLFSTP
jgi:hypothetical protein